MGSKVTVLVVMGTERALGTKREHCGPSELGVMQVAYVVCTVLVVCTFYTEKQKVNP